MIDNQLDFIDKGILAGVFIAIGACVNMTLGGIAGALFFGVGLLSILYLGLNLFTGKAGLVVEEKYNIFKLLAVWVMNATGAILAGWAVSVATPATQEVAEAVWAARLSTPPLILAVKGLFCGILMYIAVSGYRDSKKIEFVILPVSVFILCGFCHCVADMAYFGMASNKYNLIDAWPLIPVTIGNFLGCIIPPLVKAK